MWIQYARYQFLFYVFTSVEPIVNCSFLQKRINNTLFEDSNHQGESTLEQTNNLTIATGATDIAPGGCQTSVSVCTVNIAVSSLYVSPSRRDAKIDPVCIVIRMAPGDSKHSLPRHRSESTSSHRSSWIESVMFPPFF